MEQPYVRSQTGEQSDSSAEHPDWDSARRAVVDFLEACFTKEAEISIEWRSQLFELTRSASLGPDRYLDNGKALVMPRDYLTDAINTTRGRALENLVRYGFWVREKHRERVEVPEVFEVLERRFSLQPPLTSPEFALLATQFNRLFILSERSARESARFLFPLDDLAVWRISFGQYLSWTHAFNPVFNLLREHFELALESISAWTETDERRSDPIAHLGEHLFAHFIWGNDDLESDTSLLRRFYEKTSSKQWARLFDHVGRLLRNSPADLESGMKQRCKAFFEFRLAARDPEELHEFMFWLEAPSLEVEWRLNAFLRTLDITKGKGQHKTIFVESLSKLLPQQPRLVVECFAKLTEAALHEEYFYIQSDQATPILAVGLKSTDPATREAAERAQDNLLRAGHGEFLNVPESAVG